MIAYLREFHLGSIAVRMVLAMVCGAAIGYGRTQKERSAGFRTYTLICMGAAMAAITALYEFEMLQTQWAEAVAVVGSKFDASRLAAGVISGIGFLGAGIIIKGSHQQVKGLTTATGLFTTVCLGMAAGFGFYELVISTLIIIVLILNVMSPLEAAFKRRLRNITLNVEFESVDNIADISAVIAEQRASIYDIDIERTTAKGDKYCSAIFILQMARDNSSHSAMLSSVAELPYVHSVQELIA
ncbi:MAG: MgtC/SapB family protein [Lachnospiraceae bacterium]|nr:MgtC/SapB family protein [Lachnospiraceae bacterium]MBR0153590.1 MgtC/SapB family protein [Lachnospiraceae bacterium]